jgi:CxxC motif-containing protein
MNKLEAEKRNKTHNVSGDKKNLVCIMCPKGCRLSVDVKNGYSVSGNACPRGAEYGKKEVTNPTRVVTSTVKITGAMHSRCPVKTDRDIPKPLIQKAIELLNGVELCAPVRSGDIAVPNLLGTGANFVVTKDMEASN